MVRGGTVVLDTAAAEKPSVIGLDETALREKEVVGDAQPQVRQRQRLLEQDVARIIQPDQAHGRAAHVSEPESGKFIRCHLHQGTQFQVVVQCRVVSGPQLIAPLVQFLQ